MHLGGHLHDPGGVSEAQPGAALGARDLVHHRALHGHGNRGAHGGGAGKRAVRVAHGNGPRHHVHTVGVNGLAGAADVGGGRRHQGDLGDGLDRLGGLLHVIRQAEKHGGAAPYLLQDGLQGGIGVQLRGRSGGVGAQFGGAYVDHRQGGIHQRHADAASVRQRHVLPR